MLVALPVLWIAVLASAVAVVRARHEARMLFVELERLNRRARRAQHRLEPAADRAEPLVESRLRRAGRGDSRPHDVRGSG
jgi:hypothetical protein